MGWRDGACEGLLEGELVVGMLFGDCVGPLLGNCVGFLDGIVEGSTDVEGESESVGVPEGSDDCEGKLERDGSNEGFWLGKSLGRLLGDCDGWTLDSRVGANDGRLLGCSEGSMDNVGVSDLLGCKLMI